MFVIIGLGNPGSPYEKTRHNAGAWFVDQFTHNWKADNKYGVFSAKTTIAGTEVLLLKSQGYMNLSGEALVPLLKYQRIEPNQVLIAHDELDLPAGDIRLKLGGGHAGHNGLRDIMRHYSADFYRLRIGIGHPGDKSMVSDYVLQKPKPEEYEHIINSLARVRDIIPPLVQGDIHAVNRVLSLLKQPANTKKPGVAE